MGTSVTLAEFTGRIRTLAVTVDSASRAALEAAALAATRAIREELRRAAGGDSRLSGVGRAGVKINAGYQLESDRAVIRPRGPVGLVESPVRPHVIPRVRRRRARVGRPRLRINGRVVTGPIRHPGHAPRRAWTRGRARAEPAARQAFARTIREAALRSLR